MRGSGQGVGCAGRANTDVVDEEVRLSVEVQFGHFPLETPEQLQPLNCSMTAETPVTCALHSGHQPRVTSRHLRCG